MDSILPVFCLLGGAAIGAVLVWLVLRNRTSPELATALQERAALCEKASRIEPLEAELRKRDEELRGFEAQLSEARARLDAFEEVKKEFDRTISMTFESLAGKALDANSERFVKLASQRFESLKTEAAGDLKNRQQAIDNLLKPIQEGLQAVSKAAEEMENKRERAFGSIEEQLKQAVALSGEVARQTGGLKDALKKPNVRGRWGEVQLRNCIELALMEEHCDVEFQASSRDMDGELIRPDAVVRMPGGRRIAVDAKTPMDPFLEYIDAANDEERNAALIRHGRAVRTHISGLAKADYMTKVKDGPDFVVMFLPNESFLAMALEKEQNLMEEALNKKVLITTPGTLIGLLKVIRFGWTEAKLALNAQRIADEGAKLNTELIRFLDEYAKLGKAIRAASDLYDASARRVEKQISRSSLKLAEYGASSRKAVSAAASHFVGSNGVDPDELGERNGQIDALPLPRDLSQPELSEEGPEIVAVELETELN